MYDKYRGDGSIKEAAQCNSGTCEVDIVAEVDLDVKSDIRNADNEFGPSGKDDWKEHVLALESVKLSEDCLFDFRCECSRLLVPVLCLML